MKKFSVAFAVLALSAFLVGCGGLPQQDDKWGQPDLSYGFDNEANPNCTYVENGITFLGRACVAKIKQVRDLNDAAKLAGKSQLPQEPSLGDKLWSNSFVRAVVGGVGGAVAGQVIGRVAGASKSTTTGLSLLGGGLGAMVGVVSSPSSGGVGGVPYYGYGYAGGYYGSDSLSGARALAEADRATANAYWSQQRSQNCLRAIGHLPGSSSQC